MLFVHQRSLIVMFSLQREEINAMFSHFFKKRKAAIPGKPIIGSSRTGLLEKGTTPLLMTIFSLQRAILIRKVIRKRRAVQF